MNRVTTPPIIKEEQRHFIPNDMGSSFFVRRKLVKPFADFTARYFLDARIRKNIKQLKEEQPELILGETHCHSTFSDGSHPVQNILKRAASLGLDFVVITDHLIPGRFLIENIIDSFKEQAQCIHKWNETAKPIKAYPAFEISTIEGHLILIMDPEYLSLEKFSDISLQFSEYDHQYISMLDVIPKIKALGGISIIPHPEKKRAYPFGASIRWVKENLIGLVDGIEDISSGHGYQESYSQELGLASIGSSDDHFNLLMGTAATAYDGNIHDDLISAVKSRQTTAITVEKSLQYLLPVARRVL
jgi:predicted metal-dependent phosphoesterase TrpH